MNGPTPDELVNWTHGKTGTYERGCRCRVCVVGYAEYGFNLRRRRAAALIADPSLKPHGRRSTYNAWGCRCEECTEANSSYLAARRRCTS